MGNAMSAGNLSGDIQRWQRHFSICLLMEAHLTLWGQSPRISLCQCSSYEQAVPGTLRLLSVKTCTFIYYFRLSALVLCMHGHVFMHFYFICNDVTGNLLMTYDPPLAYETMKGEESQEKSRNNIN